MEAYDETETYCIQLENLWSEFQEVAGRLIRVAATLHTLCASCLESHINILAQRELFGSKFAEFDKRSLQGKWLLYPEITGIGAFDLGREPMQGLKRLISARNSLVHFKGIKCRRRFGFELPDFIKRLGLRKEATAKSIETVQNLVRELAKMEGRHEPDWLDDRWRNAILTVTPAFSF